jgi:hypothetical protein
VAAVLYERHKAKRAYAHLQALTGYWFEFIPKSEGRNYSIGKFQYNQHKKSYTFDGANYKNDGEVFCTWESTHVHSDFENRKIYYIFRASLKGALHAENYGFGVVNITEDANGLLIPVSGHYIETKEDAKPYTHSMERLEKIIEDLSLKQDREDVDAFHSRLIQRYHTHRQFLDR